VKGDCRVETFEIGEQRRLSFRIKVDWPVTLETKKGLVEGKTKDISAGGALKMAAIVIWSNNKNESNRPRVIGVKFTEISLADLKYLEKVALEEFKAKLPPS
jgi:c-di-GMP-binding flagellar brake protein YcgR